MQKKTDSYRRGALSFLPVMAVLEMTYQCNHACLFCSCPWYSPKGDYDIRPELSISDWKMLIDKLCMLGCFNLAFTGGEPLLKDGITEIIEYAANCLVEHIENEQGILITKTSRPNLFLLSNGRIMSDEIVDLCRKYDIHLSLSLSGIDTYPVHNQAGSRADMILDWFRVTKSNSIRTTVGITVTRLNIHELYETIGRSLLAGAENLLMNRFLPGGRGLRYESMLSLNREELSMMLDIAEDVLKTSCRTGTIGTELPLCAIDISRYKNLTVGTRCAAAKKFFVVDPSGYIRVCNHSTIRLCHINDINSLKMHPYWRIFAFRDYLPYTCNSCNSNNICDGGCREAAHIISGRIDGMDPLFSRLHEKLTICDVPDIK